MSEIIFMALAFFFISMIYSSIGFGGGSSYLAVMAFSAVPFNLMPRFALVCNIIVVAGGCYVYFRSKHLDIKKSLPFIVGSLPLSYIGGSIVIDKTVFMTLLGITLIAASLNIIFFSCSDRKKLKDDFLKKNTEDAARGHGNSSRIRYAIELGIGGGIGFVSGLVGIGGGVFLAPLLYTMRWGYAKKIAATSSLFILLNSIAGLAGHLSKSDLDLAHLGLIPIALAVLIGGQIGSRLGALKLSEIFVKNATAVLVMLMGVRMIFKAYV
jgi:hypothetical protein